MKEVGNIYLSWRVGTGYERFIVGVLKRNANEGVRFSYLKDGVSLACEHGFTPYTEFPDVNKDYSENVLEIFGQRITKPERSDILDFYDFWQINREFVDDKYYMLAHTQGLLPTDNFEFLADYNPVNNISFMTDLAGLTGLKIPKGAVHIGDELLIQYERKNEFDKYAVRLLKNELVVGYIKKIHCKIFHKRKGYELKVIVKAIDENGIIKRIFAKVSF